MSGYLIGIDWGGTRLKFGAVGGDGSFLTRQTYDSREVSGTDETFKRLLSITEKMIKEIGRPPAGIGIGLTGPVDPDLGVVLLPGKIKDLQGYPIVPNMRCHLGVPVWAANDGIVSIYAEKHLGHARNKEWAVSLTIGTGIGSGVMLDRKILQDPHFMFGLQIGHLVIDSSDDQLCLTGARHRRDALLGDRPGIGRAQRLAAGHPFHVVGAILARSALDRLQDCRSRRRREGRPPV